MSVPEHIPIARPLLGKAELDAVLEPVRTGWLVQGPRVAAFEAAIAGISGATHAIATSSGTTALHLALLGAGVGPGDLVAVPSLSYVATANAVFHAGARPILVDVDPVTFNLSVDDLEAKARAAGPALRAVMPVHQFGRPADMAGVTQVAQAHGLLVIEDAACALGAQIDGQAAGTLGLAGCLSFHPRKVITTGEGGMILTHDDDLAARVRRLRDHGAAVSARARSDSGVPTLPEFPEVGFNFRMTDLQGALGVVQAGRLPQILADRRGLAERYGERLAGVPGVRPPTAHPGAAWQSYVVSVEPTGPSPAALDRAHARRDAIMGHMAAAGVATRPGCHAIHGLAAYRSSHGLAPSDLPGAWQADRVSLALPLFPGLTDDEQARVVQALSEAMQATAGG